MRTTLTVFGTLWLSAICGTEAHAHSFMKKPFQKHYDLKVVACTTCHQKGEKKDLVNEFGETIQKLLAGTDIEAQVQLCKDAEQETKEILEKKLAQEFSFLLKNLDEMKSPNGKPYAQAIRDGDIAGAKPKKPGDATAPNGNEEEKESEENGADE